MIAPPHADRVFLGGKVLTMDTRSQVVDAIALHGEHILAIGSDSDIRAFIEPSTKVTKLQGRTVMPGLIDGHAHMDREGLKGLLPSLAGLNSISALIERVREIAAGVPVGQWVVTMPIGDPPSWAPSEGMYREGRYPNRHDLDRAAPNHPVLLRTGWGYWSRALPMICVANTRALRMAGITRDSVSPTDKLEILRDSQGEPTGVFLEHEEMPLAEFTLFRDAPNFSSDQRMQALAESMRLYNSFGTTGIFEGHGVAPATIATYQRLRESNRQTVRAHLVFSPGWSKLDNTDMRGVLREWGNWLARRGLGDEWLRVAGMYTEVENSSTGRLRARCAPQTGWAGFCYDSGLPKKAVLDILGEAARLKMRISGIWVDLIELFEQVHAGTQICDLRWTLGHQRVLNADQIASLADMGVCITAHANAHIHHRAEQILKQVGTARENEICPLRSLIEASVPVSLSTDNVPITLWQPIWLATERITPSGSVIAPDQRLTRMQALQAATSGGAWLCEEENQRGTLEPGKLADLLVLPADPLTCEGSTLRAMRPDLTIVGGSVVHQATSNRDNTY
jgi:predicted amidohydrolase YtcJ